jgi:hypothetical protein
MNESEQAGESAPPMIRAGLACLVCLPLVWLSTSPLSRLHNARLAEWLALAVFTLIPISVTFAVLYLSPWHRESSKIRRIMAMILSSCAVYCIDLMVAGLLLVIGCLVVTLTRVVGGN